jgi:hypothetical protein
MVSTLLAVFRHLWALPWTVVGLVAAAAAVLGGGTMRPREGVLEVWGGPLRHLPRIRLAGGIGAITLGHVVLATHERQMGWSRRHERAHVRQYERWGLFLIPAYLIASLATWLGGGNGYLDNRFEHEARAAERTVVEPVREAG